MLITAYSDTKVISDFLAAQLHISMNDFEFDSLDKFHYLIFKYKKIVIEISNQKGGFNFALFF
jgi:hypothetical protein